MNRHLQIATLFMKSLETDKLEIFIPVRVLIGKTDENEMRFYDVLSHKSYYWLDSYSDDGNYVGFHEHRTLDSVTKHYPGMKIFDALNEYLKKQKEKVYFYALENGDVGDFCLRSLPIDEFREKYGLKIAYNYFPDNLNEIDFKRLDKDQNLFMEQHKQEQEEESNKPSLPSINEVYDNIRKHIFCQDKPIKKILTAIYRNLLFEDPRLKPNIFLYGPTGVGKTAIINQISKILGLPMVIENSTDYSVTGYEGKSCGEALKHLYDRANGDLDLAQRGILVFDEIDKKRNQDGNSSNVAFGGVQDSLLKIIEGATFDITVDRHTGETIKFDTSLLTVIVSGAFEDLYKEKREKRSIGFQTNTSEITINEDDDMIKKIVNSGMKSEFIGRFNLFAELNSLNKENLKNILLNSESSAYKAYVENLGMAGYKTTINDDLANKICELAYKRGTGARALNEIVNSLFDDVMYTLFSSDDDNKEVILHSDLLPHTEHEKKKVLKNTVQ